MLNSITITMLPPTLSISMPTPTPLKLMISLTFLNGLLLISMPITPTLTVTTMFPNHLHILITITPSTNTPTLMNHTKRASTTRIFTLTTIPPTHINKSPTLQKNMMNTTITMILETSTPMKNLLQK
jgi:hypothetical protein